MKPLTRMAIAVVYWGLTRSAPLVTQTHETNLYAPLEKAGYKVDRYLHTWRTETPMVWGNQDTPTDGSGAHEFHPVLAQIDSQEDFLKAIIFSDYFNEAVWNATGEYGRQEWRPELLRNHLCALESLRRAFALVPNSNYKFILFLRPDMELLEPFPTNSLEGLPPRGILITDLSHGEGFNDRFALLHEDNAGFYANRIEWLKEFRKTHGRIVSEKVVKAAIERANLKVSLISWRIRRVRTDGTRLTS